MLIIYDASRMAQSSARMAFKATKDPMLIRDNRLVATRERRTALTGTFQFGLTYGCLVSLEPFESRIGRWWTHISNSIRERNAFVSCERPKLPAGGGNASNNRGGQGNDDDEREYIGGSMALGNIEQDLDERVPCSTTRDLVCISLKHKAG